MLILVTTPAWVKGTIRHPGARWAWVLCWPEMTWGRTASPSFCNEWSHPTGFGVHPQVNSWVRFALTAVSVLPVLSWILHQTTTTNTTSVWISDDFFQQSSKMYCGNFSASLSTLDCESILLGQRHETWHRWACTSGLKEWAFFKVLTSVEKHTLKGAQILEGTEPPRFIF